MSPQTQPQDDALQIAQAAVKLMTDFHGQAQPDDTPEMNAVFPAAAFRAFVDGHASLMYRLAQLRKSADLPGAPVKTWRERIGAGPDFPLHAPTAVEQAMVAQISDLEAVVARQAVELADPMDWPLPCDVTVGACTIKKGCRLRALVRRMETLHGMAMRAYAAPASTAIGCGGTGKYDGMPCLGCDACPRGGDFAKIVRAASGQQVLFFKEADSDDGNVLHCVASFDGFQADMKVAGMPDTAFDTVLDRVDMELADKVLAQVAELGLTEVSHG
jgi:hypothetical protein